MDRLFYNNVSSTLILLVFVFRIGASFGQWLPTMPTTEQIFGISTGNKSKEQNTPKTSVSIDLYSGLVTLQQVNLNFYYFGNQVYAQGLRKTTLFHARSIGALWAKSLCINA